jgi:TetR/AcrR family transcriptional regulator
MTEDSKMDEKELSRKEREKIEHRKLILEAAMKLFAQKGFHDVSMSEIASKAEFSVGALYTFFRSKEELYTVMLEQKAIEHFSTASIDLTTDEDVVTILTKYTEKIFKFAADNISTIRVYFSEIKGMSYALKDRLDPGIVKIHEQLIEMVSHVIEKGIQQKIFRKMDSHDAAIALHGIFDAFFSDWIRNPDRYPQHLDTKLIIDLFLRGMINNETK